MKSVRKIKPSKKGSFRGNFISQKVGKTIQYESLLERDFMQLLEFDPLIQRYDSQPLEINYRYKGRKRRYYPDFKAKTINGEIIIYEVKPKTKLKLEENLIKFEAGSLFCEKNELHYKVVTEKDIRKGNLISNLELLREVNSFQTNHKVMEQILYILKQVEKSSKKNLKESIENITDAEFEGNLYYLIYNHKINVDLISEPISDNTILSLEGWDK